MELISLFVSSFLSSTLLPGGSEALLLYLTLESPDRAASYWLVATIGNSTGSLLTMAMGTFLAKYYPTRPHEDHRSQKAIKWLQLHGSPILLLAWLPLIGDLLCFFAGWLHLPWRNSLLFLLIGKAARYALIMGIALFF